MAILSRLPIRSWENRSISRLSTQGEEAPRPMPGFLQVTVAVGVDVVSPHLRVLAASVVPTDASDHLPVVAELEVPRS